MVAPLRLSAVGVTGAGRSAEEWKTGMSAANLGPLPSRGAPVGPPESPLSQIPSTGLATACHLHNLVLRSLLKVQSAYQCWWPGLVKETRNCPAVPWSSEPPAGGASCPISTSVALLSHVSAWHPRVPQYPRRGQKRQIPPRHGFCTCWKHWVCFVPSISLRAS